MELTITIELNNHAFQDGMCGLEIKRILEKAGRQIEGMQEPMKYGETLRDINGNICGDISID